MGVIKATELAALERAAECLRLLAHPHRLRIIQLLSQKEFTVGEIAQACGIPAPMASDHLRLMQHCGFLSSVKRGRCVYYRIVESHLTNLLSCIEGRFGVGCVEESILMNDPMMAIPSTSQSAPLSNFDGSGPFEHISAG
ncbi:MAG: hypothetical protein KatS3mg113_1071 [Planctomycetaceae bacterium]|nr:MAG: hypothetical protein KatS3mg113_1071 [Planctomycetaceae bacterium]